MRVLFTVKGVKVGTCVCIVEKNNIILCQYIGAVYFLVGYTYSKRKRNECAPLKG